MHLLPFPVRNSAAKSTMISFQNVHLLPSRVEVLVCQILLTVHQLKVYPIKSASDWLTKLFAFCSTFMIMAFQKVQVPAHVVWYHNAMHLTSFICWTLIPNFKQLHTTLYVRWPSKLIVLNGINAYCYTYFLSMSNNYILNHMFSLFVPMLTNHTLNHMVYNISEFERSTKEKWIHLGFPFFLLQYSSDIRGSEINCNTKIGNHEYIHSFLFCFF